MLFYFDNCVWCRIFDDSNNDKIMCQRKDIKSLLELRRQGKINVASSDANEAELMPMLDKNMEAQKQEIMKFVNENSDIRLATAYNRLGHSKWARLGVMRLAKEGTQEKIDALIDLGFDHDDAVHIFTAMDNNVQYFISVDEAVIKNRNNLGELKILLPQEALSRV